MNNRMAGLRRAVVAGSALLLSVALAACSQGPGASSPAATSGTSSSAGTGGGTTVNVTLTEFKVALDKTQLPAGTATFQVTNNGTIVHEFVVFKTDDAADQLPTSDDGNEVDEDDSSLTSMGEVEDVDVGATKSFSAELTPGSYVAICNVEGHYMAGMHVPFTVQ